MILLKNYEWAALIIAIGLEIVWAYPAYERGEMFYGMNPGIYLILPVIIGIVIWKFEDLFGIMQPKGFHSVPEIWALLQTSEEGKMFKEKFNIPSNLTWDSVTPVEGFWAFKVKSGNDYKYLIASIRKNITPVFWGWYSWADYSTFFDKHKQMYRQAIPKDKPTITDILEELPEESRTAYAIKNIPQEASK